MAVRSPARIAAMRALASCAATAHGINNETSPTANLSLDISTPPTSPPGLQGERCSQLGQLARAVTKLLELHAHLVQQREIEIRHWCPLGVANVPATPETTARPAHHQRRQIHVVMRVRVAHPAAIDEDAMVEQRSVAVRCGA